MSTPLLQVKALQKAYGAIQAVDSVSFNVMPGEIFGVIGPNGSGKTTLFNSVFGQVKPDGGTVLLNNADITGLSPFTLSRHGIGRTFQTLQVFSKMSVRDNLIVAAQEHSHSMLGRLFLPVDAGLSVKADALIEQFGLCTVAHLPSGMLSYGQQKLVDIAMAFMSNPLLVLLDEPCAGVHTTVQENLRRLLTHLNQTLTTTFIVIEHQMDFVMQLCHRILVLADGKVMALGTPQEIQANRQVLEAYLGY